MGDYLAKPVTAERLRAVVGRWIGGTGAEVDPRTVDPDVLAGLRAAGLLEAVVALYVGQTPGQLAALRRAVERGEAETLAAAAHQLKGSSEQVGARRLAALAATMQEQGETGPLDGTAAVVAALEQGSTCVRAVLEGGQEVAPP
jgi:HPt (histidine-containing phosphotransfer) domain-containing protein